MHLKQPIYLALLTLTFLIGFFRWRALRPGDRVITILMGITLLQEVIAYACFELFGDNLFTYHIYSPIEFFVICLYFNFTNALLKKYSLGIIIGCLGIVVGIINTAYFQPFSTFNSYYLLFEGTVIILLCLFGLYEILLADFLDFGKSSYFWIALLLMFYWSVTYTGWGVFNLIGSSNMKLVKLFISILYFANLLFYTGIAAVFLYYKKFKSSVL